MGAMSEEAKTEPGDQSEEEKLSDADIKSEKFEYDEDSDSDDEGQRAAAALLCQNRSIQSEIKRKIEELEQQEMDEKNNLKNLKTIGRTRLQVPAELRISSGPSFFSTRTRQAPRSASAKATIKLSNPPKNVHAVRRHLFLEKYNIKPHGVYLKGSQWKQADDFSLVEVVKSQLMEDLFRTLYHGKVQQVPPRDRPQFFIDVQKKIAAMSLGELWTNVEYKSDWHRISARMTKRGFEHSAKQCYVRYLHKVHPELKKGKFSKEEDASLIKLSTRYEGYDWDVIAKHMPSWRTAWRCFSRYQRCLNNAILKAGWSEEQMEALRRSVRELGYFHDTQGSRLPLQTIVSRLGPGKSTFNVSGTLAKWKQNIYQQSSLPWSEKQQRSLDLALEIYGPGCSDWKMLGRHVPERDPADLYYKWEQNQGRAGEWSSEEDDAFRKAVAKYGPGNWSMIRSEVPTRNHGQIYSRFHKLFPEQSRLYDVLLASRARVFSRKRRDRHRSSLVASDFVVKLTVEDQPDGQRRGIKRLTTGDKMADRHLTRINKVLAKTAKGIGPKAKAKSKAQAKSKAKAKAAPKAKAKGAPKGKAKAKAKANAKAKAKAKATVKVEPKAKAKAEAKAEPKAKMAKAKAKSKAKAKANSKSKGKASKVEEVKVEYNSESEEASSESSEWLKGERYPPVEPLELSEEDRRMALLVEAMRLRRLRRLVPVNPPTRSN